MAFEIPIPLFDGDTLTGVLPASMTTQVAELSENAQRFLGDTTLMLLHAALDAAGTASRNMAQLGAEMRQLIVAQQESVTLLSHNAVAISRNVEAITSNVELATRPDSYADLRAQIAVSTASLASASTRLDATMSSFSALAGSLERGEGSAGKLLRDPALYERTESLLASMEALMRDLKANPKKYINVSVLAAYSVTITRPIMPPVSCGIQKYVYDPATVNS
ncbi:MAG TPA: hypothetical protein VMM77_12290 [Gemmatimonadaceae bacterium]|nr:hypothetical protein [Gemmatimonadaceae bacterium]